MANDDLTEAIVRARKYLDLFSHEGGPSETHLRHLLAAVERTTRTEETPLADRPEKVKRLMNIQPGDLYQAGYNELCQVMSYIILLERKVRRLERQERKVSREDGLYRDSPVVTDNGERNEDS